MNVKVKSGRFGGIIALKGTWIGALLRLLFYCNHLSRSFLCTCTIVLSNEKS